ncbi:carbamoyltransferase HypF [Natronobacterium gregoryi]|uniref:Carbamoyltransferase n=2 Tax=Natronobacterium gregoryi TaxID=44930 RepID=L0AJJ0_NATGS|nr:carbamoyltransferase HypF [Natronobacterium gregoryi]AFZ73347.1 (NiFe) hydrogenase maturation protein HypF [Natronobacterium gregoryi SP2]PLK18785.1 carbamoyltransferase HypF [Natronobacterium gregoryi SP2]SFJ63860.1 hydrogenase maturation protein HypF [Natronobacterium gregoryi]
MTTESADRRRVEVTVTGVVQAVGFRPFVYRRATTHDLTGTVRNTGDAGVEIELEGRSDDVESFLSDLRERPPPLAVVESVTVEEADPVGESESEFVIEPSTDGDGGSGTIPPDTGICETCLEDIRDPDSRYHRYWATACVDCGPRYTVIESLPYDRPRTTMDEFPMCTACREEYEDPMDRRYHAQTTACPECGPSLSLLDDDRGELATDEEAIAATTDRLANGELVAIRGIGGTHLACLATDETAIERLRDRTGRPAKPFALMASSLDDVESFAAVDDREQSLLTDVRRPIVVLETERDDAWLEAVAPGLHTVGVMLPYAGLHHLLFDELDDPLVMTSANLPGQPMATTVDAIYEQLEGVIDAALVHDREITARCDDSVVRVVDDDRRFLRRSRGWVPRPLPRPDSGPEVLALGAEFDNVVALARDADVVPSQHLGDVDGPATEAFLRETTDHLTELFGVEPSVVACDRHPGFRTTELAATVADDLEVDAPVRVQHHHAHAAGLLAEHDRDQAVVVVADGTGYGSDGTIWGGEVLSVTPASFDRVGGLDTFQLPGGESAIRRPARILASLLQDDERIDELLVDRTPLDEDAARTVRESVAADVNAPETTSAGRFLDASSALLDVCSHRRYQGEPALQLEAAAADADPVDIDVPYTERDGRQVVDVAALVQAIDDMRDTHSRHRLAATAQETLARGLGTIAARAATDRGIDAVGFTGGVAYNEAISRTIRATVESHDLDYLAPDRVPPGDAGIAYGQTVVAANRVE